MRDCLQLLREGPVARLRLDRPQLHNAFDAALIADLTDALEELGRDADVRVVVLEGAGASFSAGADLNWMRGMAAASEADNREDSLRLARLMRTLDELPSRPSPASTARPSAAASAWSPAATSPSPRANATFGLTEARLGLLPAVISPYVIAAIGARQARRWFATAETLRRRTKRIASACVHQVVDDEAALDAAVQQQVDLLLQAGPVAAATAKALVRRVADTHDAHTHRRRQRRAHRAPARLARRPGRPVGLPRQAQARLDGSKSCQCSTRSSSPTAARSPAA